MSEIEWRNGDIFFWRYKTEADTNLQYWCCSRQAIVVMGWLQDTYWAFINNHTVNFPNTGRVWNRAQADRLLSLEFKGNLDEFDVIAEYNSSMYDVADILDLRHANSSQKQVYLRKGAQRNQSAMLVEVDYKIEKAESDIRHAKYQVERLLKEKAKIEAGELEGVWL